MQATGVLAGTQTVARYNFGGTRAGQANFVANYAMAGPGGVLQQDCWNVSRVSIPEKRWACLEWQYDGTSDELRFWADSQPLRDMTVIRRGDGCVPGKYGPDGSGQWHGPVFNEIRIGWEQYGTSLLPVQVWVDDLVLDGKRVGCP